MTSGFQLIQRGRSVPGHSVRLDGTEGTGHPHLGRGKIMKRQEEASSSKPCPLSLAPSVDKRQHCPHHKEVRKAPAHDSEQVLRGSELTDTWLPKTLLGTE